MIPTHGSYRKLQYSPQSTEKHVKEETLQNNKPSSGFANGTRMQSMTDLTTIDHKGWKFRSSVHSAFNVSLILCFNTPAWNKIRWSYTVLPLLSPFLFLNFFPKRTRNSTGKEPWCTQQAHHGGNQSARALGKASAALRSEVEKASWKLRTLPRVQSTSGVPFFVSLV